MKRKNKNQHEQQGFIPSVCEEESVASSSQSYSENHSLLSSFQSSQTEAMIARLEKEFNDPAPVENDTPSSPIEVPSLSHMQKKIKELEMAFADANTVQIDPNTTKNSNFNHQLVAPPPTVLKIASRPVNQSNKRSNQQIIEKIVEYFENYKISYETVIISIHKCAGNIEMAIKMLGDKIKNGEQLDDDASSLVQFKCISDVPATTVKEYLKDDNS